MPTPTQVEDMRRQRHVMEVSDAIDARLAAARTAQTVLDDLVASGRVDVAHTNPCWVALEDELHWLGAAAADIDLADGYDAAYDLCSFWSPEALRRGAQPAAGAPTPTTPVEILAAYLTAVGRSVRVVTDAEVPFLVVEARNVLHQVRWIEVEPTEQDGWVVRSYVDSARERRPLRVEVVGPGNDEANEGIAEVLR